jgi:hypothetical protein
MKTGKVLAVAVLWAASLLGVGLWAQSVREPQPAPNLLYGEPVGTVITGENLGFQPVAGPTDRDGRVPGYFVVKMNGQWVGVTSSIRIVR